MKTLQAHLVNYAAYHRDLRNIHTHFVGIPLIVLAVAVLLACLPLVLGLSALHPVLLGAIVFYLRLDLGLGALMAAFMLLAGWAGVQLAALPWGGWLGLMLFVAGWVIQFVGHWYEGRKPAFVDDLVGLLVGPLFVMAEWLFLLGFYRDLQARIIEGAGPVRAVQKVAAGR
ncbi:DUF962 domain-containing protein [Vogesella sp. XCS3]|uniref:Mpo1 family 2-hydroxy fatty acid dioxygenase n=1 Tax=Vogesella sp. XCS3 TaxID=2877939 RepID=UPI001D0B32DF|nr:Mpo1-like protein [Vogesella sp. XCS3]UDM18022.1 DUF962 domain-containing protein [Vogesella sp. XCS3]